MSTYRELIVMVADLAKQVSDDDTLTYRHIAFLLNIYRAYLLKQKYLNKSQEIPSSNYQTICAKMTHTSTSSLNNCCGNSCYGHSSGFNILRSENTVTYPLSFSDTKASLIRCAGKFSIQLNPDLEYSHNPTVFETEERYNEFLDYMASIFNTEPLTIESCIQQGSMTFISYETSCKEDITDIIKLVVENFPETDAMLTPKATNNPQECNPQAIYDATMRYYGNVNMVSRERFGYVGIGKYHTKSVYGTIGVDGHLYIKAKEDISIYNKAFITSIFENPDKAYEQSSCTYKYTDKESGKAIIKQCPESDGICDPWDRQFPIEESLQSQLINLVLKDISNAARKSADRVNNSADDYERVSAVEYQKYYDKRNGRPKDGTE